MKITKIRKNQQRLTIAQEKYAKKFAEKQIEKYLSTKQSATDKQIEVYVNNAYKVAGKNIPSKIRWFKSPEDFCKYWNSVGNSVGNSVWASVGDSVRASVGASVGASVWASVWASVRASVGASVRDSVWASVWASVRASVRASVWASVWASYDADDWSFYRFFNDIYKENDLLWLSCLSENVTGYAFYEKECWLVRKPVILTRNEKGQLHGENDMAIKWADGFGFYYWNGVRATEKSILHPEKLTKKDWMSEKNLEVRRVIQERMGEEFVKKIKGKLIDTGKLGRLYEIELPNDPEKVAHYVRVKDASTPREYYLRTPPTIITADESVAWTFDIPLNDYKLEQES